MIVFQNSCEEVLTENFKIKNYFFSEIDIFPLENWHLILCMWLCVSMLVCAYTPLLFKIWNKKKWEKTFKQQNTEIQNKLSNPDIFWNMLSSM